MESRTGKRAKKKKRELYQLRCVTTSERNSESATTSAERKEQVTRKKKAVAKLYKKVFGRIGSIEKMIWLLDIMEDRQQ